MSYDSRPETYEHISQVRRNLFVVIEDLMRRAHEHDNSKLRPPEVELFDKLTPRLRETTYMSDEYKGFLEELKPALDHHYAVSTHHPQHYEDGIQGMDLLDLTEMLCDWLAATKRMGGSGSIRESIEINQERFGYSDELKQIFLNTLLLLIGEDE